MIPFKNSLFLLILFSNILFAQNVAPVLNATGNQIYCPQTAIPIVTNMSIIDPDDTGIVAMYVQISSGYVLGQDLLILTGIHPAINSSWNAIEGKLTLSGTTVNPTYLQFIAAIEAVVFNNTSPNPNGQRIFSITVGQANYLESTDHYYQYVSNIGINWLNAKNAAAASTYYGLQGYLATITSVDEVQISGIQASGAGWIGGTDEVSEGTWKWATGPELGTVFWNGAVSGTTPNFAFWNSNEPNNLGEEDYAHVTAPGVGQPGSWNDLTLNGESGGDYQPKGYIVEYGGMPGDPVLQISTTSTITIPQITSTVNNSRCGSGTLTLQAISNVGNVNWYTSPTGGTPIFTGNTFTTPVLNATTIYYVNAFSIGCALGNRTQVTATIQEIPVVSFAQPNPICQNTTATINATTTIGTINWYTSSTSTTILSSGNTFITPVLNATTTYYFEAVNNGCLSNRMAITIPIILAPIVVDETVVFCENTTVLLQSGIVGATYLWSTGATTQNIVVSTPGNYSVLVTNAQNCSATKNSIVVENTAPEIISIEVYDLTAEIIISGNGVFEYSLDTINFQNSNIFNFTNGGVYTCYVREIGKDCGSDSKTFVVIDYPKFFTPNSDGINDFWEINGMSFLPMYKVTIFDRYGKLITVLNKRKLYWDGKFNGEMLSESDYWFVANLGDDFPEYKGHFTLKR